MGKIEEVIGAWDPYIESIDDWEALVGEIKPKPSGCGQIYEFKTNPVDSRPNEDFCIADMRELAVTEPHYHPGGVTEIYFIMRGFGRVYVGSQEHVVGPGSVVVMPPLTAHFTFPEGSMVAGVVNTPPFQPQAYIAVHETDPVVQFDKALFSKLASTT